MMQSSDGLNTQRALSIDIFRGFALVFMVLLHFMIFFGNTKAMNSWLYFSFNHILGDWGASGFLMIMGISQVLSGQKHADLDNHILFKRALIRGVYIFSVGLLMLALAWGPHKIWQWDILTLMGFATVALYFCRFLPAWGILLVAAVIAGSTPFFRGQLAVAHIWGNNFMQVPMISSYFPGLILDPAGEMETFWSVKDIVLGFLFTGDFPVFPWVLFPLVGFVLGQRIIGRKIHKDLPWLMFAGIAFVFTGLGMGYAGSLRPEASIISGYIAPLSFYPDSFPMILFQMGMTIVVILSLYTIYDIRRTPHRKVGSVAGFFSYISRSSLTFYFLHYLLIGWPLALIYILSGTYPINDLMGSLPAFGFGLAAVGVLGFVLKTWEKIGNKYKLEWFLSAIIRRFA
ncbi:MAG: heparan-alpha-glucosaminide N-acetyltransferase domain-containing protein [Pseudomonadota bacterium]